MSTPEGEQWDWPDGLDALSAAAEHHQLLLENELVRVLLTQIPVRDGAPLARIEAWAKHAGR
jgi:hypothetical protein